MKTSLVTTRINGRCAIINGIANKLRSMIAQGTKLACVNLTAIEGVSELSVVRQGVVALGFSTQDLIGAANYYQEGVSYLEPKALELTQAIGQLRKRIGGGDVSKGLLDRKFELTEQLAPISSQLEMCRGMVEILESEIKDRANKPVETVVVETEKVERPRVKDAYRQREDWKQAWLKGPVAVAKK